MDLYDALKNGASEEELLESFKKELGAAADRLTAERLEEEEKAAMEAARLEELDDVRWDTACALEDYIELLLDIDVNELTATQEIYDVLCDLEEMNYVQSLYDALKNIKALDEQESKSNKKKDHTLKVAATPSDNDWAIISSFISNL